MRKIMGKLIAFNSISLDGFFTDANSDMSWAHSAVQDEEWNAYVAGNASGGGMLVFGRITYELMIKFWPTPAAAKAFPVVAERMNNGQKVVFSRTLTQASWNNTRLVKGNIVEEVRTMKKQPTGMAILGSGSIIAQLTDERLIDEYQIVVIPIILGKGRTMFDGIKRRLNLKLTHSRTFGNGNVVLHYAPKV